LGKAEDRVWNSPVKSHTTCGPRCLPSLGHQLAFELTLSVAREGEPKLELWGNLRRVLPPDWVRHGLRCYEGAGVGKPNHGNRET